LLTVQDAAAGSFYESEALRGGWSVRQLDRQIASQFYERSKAARRTLVAKSKPDDETSPDDHIRDPFVLEFLNLKDEYSESELEDALIKHLEKFLLEPGGEFTFIARQKRLRVGDKWYRVTDKGLSDLIKSLSSSASPSPSSSIATTQSSAATLGRRR
jgi:predicted nuclease of restriction endonuclease-like (RecB) superfamily